MSIILGIETSTKVCSIAISKNNQLLAMEEVGGAYTHAENVNPFIEKVVNSTICYGL